MFRTFANLLVLCAVVSGANAGKVSVEASSSSGKATVLVNGEPVEPGERDVDGSHVNYQRRSETGNQGSCSYSSVSVTSSGDEPTKINVQQGSGCDADDDDDPTGRFAFRSHRAGGHGAAGGRDDLGGRMPHAHGRDVKDRRFFDIDGMIDELRRSNGRDGANSVDDLVDDDGSSSHTWSNSGSGAAGDKREVHADGEGFHARARTGGSGPHRETIDASTRRMPGGGVARSVRVSASSSSSDGDADK